MVPGISTPGHVGLRIKRLINWFMGQVFLSCPAESEIPPKLSSS